jgi:hypothetical protein
MANNIRTQGYFIKRLRDSGYIVDRIFSNYNQADSRAWTVIIDPGGASIFCTCYINEHYENGPQLGSSTFELFDGDKFIPGRYKIRTSSFEVLVEQLVKWGINNKAPNYGKKTIKDSSDK